MFMKVGKKTFDEVREWWAGIAAVDKDAEGLSPTARDPYLQKSIERVVDQYLSPGHRVIDIGCGDGASSIGFAAKVESLLGIDYIPTYVERARSKAMATGRLNTEFQVGSALNLRSIYGKRELFDVAISIRCLINLANFENQSMAIREIARCLKPGAIYITSEGWQEGWDGLNALRKSVGLPEIEIVPYNVLMSRKSFEQVSASYFDVVKFHSLGIYHLLSRVVQPVYMAPEAPRHDHPLNRIASELSEFRSGNEFEDIDYSGIYVLRRNDRNA